MSQGRVRVSSGESGSSPGESGQVRVSPGESG